MKNKLDQILENLNDIILGREDNIKIALCSVIAGGHILIEDRPGVGKTTLSRLLAKVSGHAFNRIQFTSDLMPSDILGFLHKDGQTSEFIFKKGPVFTDVLLADEINRASSKTQSALLQAMEEREVSVENLHFKLSDSFCVIATQNQLDNIGTHSLPESQLDRFCISMSLGINSREVEKRIITRPFNFVNDISVSLTQEESNRIKEKAQEVYISEECFDFILELVDQVRAQTHKHISIRASQDIVKMSKMMGIIENREFIIPKDIRFVAPYCLAHRVIDGDSIEFAIKNIHSIVEKIADKF